MTNLGGLGLIIDDEWESVRIRRIQHWDDEEDDNQCQKNERKDVQLDIHS